jgi:hypothetical protein
MTNEKNHDKKLFDDRDADAAFPPQNSDGDVLRVAEEKQVDCAMSYLQIVSPPPPGSA